MTIYTLAFAGLTWLVMGSIATADTWIQLDTPHVTVIGDVDASRLRAAANLHERVRARLGMLFPHGRVASPTLVIIEDCERDARATALPIVEARARAWILTGCNDGARRQAALGAMVALLTRSSFESVPLWLEVGLGEVFSTAMVADDPAVLTVGTPIAAHYVMLKTRTLPVRAMLSATRESRSWTDPLSRQLFTAQAWAYVHFLLCSDPPRRSQVRDFLQRVSEGATPEHALRAYVDDLDTLAGRVRDYLNQGLFPRWTTASIPTPPTETPIAPPREPQRLSDAATLAWRIELMADQETKVPSTESLQKMLDAKPASAPLLAAWARVNADSGRRAEAHALFEQALAAAAPRERAWVEYAYAAALLQPRGAVDHASAPPRAELERAESLLASNELAASGHADALALLAWTYLWLGNHGGAVQQATLAFQALPRHEYALLLARTWLEAGRPSTARGLLAPLADHGRTGEIRETARRLLKRAASTDVHPPASLPLFRPLAAGELRLVGRLRGFTCSPSWVVVDLETTAGPRKAAITRLDLLTFISYRAAPIETPRCGARTNPEVVHLIARPAAPLDRPSSDSGAQALPEGVSLYAVAVEFLPDTPVP